MGGEFLVGDTRSVERAAHLRHFALPGGDSAVKEPIRITIALLTEIYGEHIPELSIPALHILSSTQKNLFAKMAIRRINTPVTSSIGRLFDGISALIGICTHIEYEAQAAIELEALLQCDLHMAQPFAFSILESEDHLEVDYRPMVHELITALTAHSLDLPELSRRFHSTIVEIITAVCTRLSVLARTTQVVLSGGVFCNEFLLNNALDQLQAAGLKVYCHQLVPTNDGGISLGQIVVASSLSQMNQINNKEIEYV